MHDDDSSPAIPPSDENDSSSSSDGSSSSLSLDGDKKETAKGIPDFWLTVFQNANESLLCGTFESIDEPIMKFLQDVTVTLPPENTSFTITFHFAPNQFFTNKELTKEYLMKNTFDPEDPLDFDGPEIFKSKGCKIDWKAGKNTTVKVSLSFAGQNIILFCAQR